MKSWPQLMDATQPGQGVHPPDSGTVNNYKAQRRVSKACDPAVRSLG
jgi:hypothetical protein